MNPKNTIVVNFLAGSGAGKSTMATDIFARLKRQNVDCELAMEYAKDLVWEDNFKALKNQILVFANQLYRIDKLVGRVNVIITDSPLLLSIMFKKHHLFKYSEIENHFDELVVEVFNTYDNMNFFIERSVPFNPNGRIEKTIEEAIENDNKIKNILDKYSIPYRPIFFPMGYVNSVEFIISQILKKLGDY